MGYYDNKTCLITGAASGIGFAVSKRLLDEGAKVTLVDIDENALEKAKQRLEKYDGRTLFIHGDVTDAASFKAAVDQTCLFGGLDVIINNAGICRGMLYEETTLAEWRKIIDINIMGVVHGIHYGLPFMIKNGGGHIVNIASVSGLVPTPFESMYSATKFAVVGLSESLRFELERYNIAVSVVCPGDVDTDIFNKSIYLHGKLISNAKQFVPYERLSAPDAAAIIVEGMKNKTPKIIVGDAAKYFYDMYRQSQEQSDMFMRGFTEERIFIFKQAEELLKSGQI